jgi:hypothetical protein
MFLPNENLNILYQSYLRRENDLENYLDIFRGIDTRKKRNQDLTADHKFHRIILKGYSIKYILIAEAAPPTGKYIYTDASGNYLLAALKAFNVPNLGRIKTSVGKLEALAKEGILILDLFPFNLNYNLKISGSTLREILIANHLTSDFLINTRLFIQ